MTTKTIEDYQNSLKILKLKVIKLTKQKEELEAQIRQHGNNLEFLIKNQGEPDLFDSMRKLYQGCKRICLTPEMIFRVADIYQLGLVSVTVFTQILQQIRLGLNQEDIQKLIQFFDIDNSGMISMQEYFDSLRCFDLNTENFYKKDMISYTYQSFTKYAVLVQDNNLDGVLGYNKMDPKRTGFIEYKFYYVFIKSIKNQGKYLTEREIIGSFNYLDLDRSMKISKQCYLDNLSKVLELIKKHNIQNENNNNHTQNKSIQQNKKNLESTIIQSVNEKLKILKVQGFDINVFLFDLLLNLNNYSHGIQYQDFLNIGEHYKLNRKEILNLFKILDLNQNGSIDYNELMRFFLTTKTITERYDLLFIIFTLKLQSMEISINDYLMLESIDINSMISIDEFYLLSHKMFNIDDQIQAQLLFKSLDIDDSNFVSANEIIQNVQLILGNLKQNTQELYDVSETGQEDIFQSKFTNFRDTNNLRNESYLNQMQQSQVQSQRSVQDSQIIIEKQAQKQTIFIQKKEKVQSQ